MILKSFTFIKILTILGLAVILPACSTSSEKSQGIELQRAVNMPRALSFEQTDSSQTGSVSAEEQEFLNNIWTGNMVNILEYTHIPDTPKLWDNEIHTFIDNNHATPYNGQYRSSASDPDYTNGKFYRNLTDAKTGDLVEMGYMAWLFDMSNGVSGVSDVNAVNNIQSISLYMHGFIYGNTFDQRLSATSSSSVYYYRHNINDNNHRYLTYSITTPISSKNEMVAVELKRLPLSREYGSNTPVTENDYQIYYTIDRNYTNGQYQRGELGLRYSTEDKKWDDFFSCYHVATDTNVGDCFDDSNLKNANQQELDDLMARTTDLARIVTAFDKIDRKFIVAKRPTINTMPSATTESHPEASFDGLLQKLIADTTP